MISLQRSHVLARLPATRTLDHWSRLSQQAWLAPFSLMSKANGQHVWLRTPIPFEAGSTPSLGPLATPSLHPCRAIQFNASIGSSQTVETIVTPRRSTANVKSHFSTNQKDADPADAYIPDMSRFNRSKSTNDSSIIYVEGAHATTCEVNSSSGALYHVDQRHSVLCLDRLCVATDMHTREMQRRPMWARYMQRNAMDDDERIEF